MDAASGGAAQAYCRRVGRFFDRGGRRFPFFFPYRGVPDDSSGCFRREALHFRARREIYGSPASFGLDGGALHRAVPVRSGGAFLWPGLRGREHTYAVVVLFAVPVLFILGAAICYRFMAPLAFDFFLSFGSSDGIEALWSFREYLSLLFDLMIAAGLLLQMPLFLFVLLALGFVSPESVARYRPHVILLIFFLAAILTPPDIFTQVFLGVPLYLLFEGAFLLGRVLRKDKNPRSKEV